MKLSVGFFLAVLLVFLTSTTVANEPILIFGYGLGAFGLLIVGLLLDPLPATVSVLVGSAAGASLIAYTQSAFTLVVVGSVLIRTIQAYALSRLKKRIGALGAASTVVALGALVATALGFGFYGGDAISTPMTIFEAVYIPPALVVMKAFEGVTTRDRKLLGTAAFAATCGVFFSASPFGILVGGSASLFIVLLVSYLVLKPSLAGAKKLGSALLIITLLAVPVSLASNPTALSYNLRTALYPFYPDSLGRSQWTQANSSAACIQGNVAGGGTIENGVWGPQRLRVVDTCVTLTGVVMGLAPTSGPSNDDDYSIDIKLDPQYSYMLSLGSVILQNGNMHVEVVPSQQPSLAGVLGSLKPGDRVQVTGAFVIDTDHGFWSEVHPAWQIAILGN